ncbi:hypothetical protein AVEN_1754-1, partial [Araneus ventricosus]
MATRVRSFTLPIRSFRPVRSRTTHLYFGVRKVHIWKVLGFEMAKAKTTHVLVLMKSMITKHKFPAVRPRQAEQLEMIKFDPY